jgi:hypothetical protein
MTKSEAVMPTKTVLVDCLLISEVVIRHPTTKRVMFTVQPETLVKVDIKTFKMYFNAYVIGLFRDQFVVLQ